MTIGFHVNHKPLTDPGLKRKNNQDCVDYFEPGNYDDLIRSGRLYIVADGVGGGARGEKASQYSVERVLFEYFQMPDISPGERLRKAMQKAGNEIFEYAEKENFPKGMATTMVAAVIIGEQLIVANVGDSRAYLIREGMIEQITRDHTEVAEMIEGGLLTEEEARYVKGKNRISRSLGGELNPKVDVFKPIRLQTNDKILLCSDGLTRYASDMQLVQIIGNKSPVEATEDLVSYANQSGGADNVSVFYIAIGQPQDEAEPAMVPKGHEPRNVNWETIEWKRQKSVQRITFREALRSGIREYPQVFLALAILFVLAIVTVSWIGIIEYRSDAQERALAVAVEGSMRITLTAETLMSMQAEEASAIAAVEAANLEMTKQVQQNEQNLTATALSISVTQTAITQLTPDGVPTEDDRPVESDQPTPTQVTPVAESGGTNQSLGKCEYTVESGDILLKIAEKLGTSYDPNRITCAHQDANCRYDSNNPDSLTPGWRLLFQDVSKENCKTSDGTFIEN